MLAVVQKTLLGKLTWLESGNVPFLVRGNTSIYTSMVEKKVSIAMIFSLEAKNRSCSKLEAKEDLLIYSFLIGPGPGPRVSAFCSHMSENCITLSSCLYLAPSTVRAMDWIGQTLWTPEQKMSENSGPPQRKRNYVAKLMVDHECNFLQEFPHFLRFFMVEVLQKKTAEKEKLPQPGSTTSYRGPAGDWEPQQVVYRKNGLEPPK